MELKHHNFIMIALNSHHPSLVLIIVARSSSLPSLLCSSVFLPVSLLLPSLASSAPVMMSPWEPWEPWEPCLQFMAWWYLAHWSRSCLDWSHSKCLLDSVHKGAGTDGARCCALGWKRWTIKKSWNPPCPHNDNRPFRLHCSLQRSNIQQPAAAA